MAKRECKTCTYIKYTEMANAVGYVCTLCGKYVDGFFRDENTRPKEFTEHDFSKYREELTEALNSRKGYRYWCPLVKHR